MTRLDWACLAWLLLLFLVAIAALIPAPAQFFWFLRVGVPELGVLFFLAALPAAGWLARNSPKVSLAFVLALGGLFLFPWFQAVLVARTLPAGMSRAFGEPSLERSPLRLGDLKNIEKITEIYHDKLQWDRYRPADGSVKARLLFVHGGSWRNGTRDDYPQLFSYLAGRGYEVVSLTYGLAPEHPYPESSEDIATAISLLVADEVPLFLAGRSSGGHLALLAAYTHPDQVAGVIGIYAPVDMVWSFENPSNPAILNSREALQQFLGGTPLEKPDVYREASPIFQVTKAGPPTLLIHGGHDSLVYLRQSQMLSAALLKKQVPRYLVELPWAEHGSDVSIYGPTGRLTAWAIEDFISRVVATSSP